MRAMEYSSHIIEDNAHPGPSPFTYFRSAGDQQTFNICPTDVRTDGMCENGLQGFAMF
jgi:hypothetical protein